MTLPSTDREGIDRLKLHFSKIQIANADADLDRDPYFAAAWNPMTLSNGATGTIDWVATFGLPKIPKLVWLFASVRDSGSAAGDYYINFQARATTTRVSFRPRANRENNDNIESDHGCVAVADNGTTYYSVVASGVNTMDVWLSVVVWMK